MKANWAFFDRKFCLDSSDVLLLPGKHHKKSEEDIVSPLGFDESWDGAKDFFH